VGRGYVRNSSGVRAQAKCRRSAAHMRMLNKLFQNPISRLWGFEKVVANLILFIECLQVGLYQFKTGFFVFFQGQAITVSDPVLAARAKAPLRCRLKIKCVVP
jgi:hypothetical protein